MKTYNSFQVAQSQVLEAAKHLKLDEPTIQLLTFPQKEFSFTMSIKMDDGSTKIFHGYIIQYNYARGPAKGGIRFHNDETVDTIRALACWMTWTSSISGRPTLASRMSAPCSCWLMPWLTT